jgi:excinuclease ABC subunit A
MGPGAGEHGGQVVAEGTPEQIRRNPASLTGQYLCGALEIAVPKKRRRFDRARVLRLKGARGNNLKNIELALPVGLFVCVTGVSGSGKSTLINDTLYHAVARELWRAEPAAHDSSRGWSSSTRR